MSERHPVEKLLKEGIIALSFRSLLVHVIQAVSLLVLAKWLVSADYGVFAILNSWIGVAVYFTDVGTMGALIQMQGEPTEDQIRASASLQFILGCLIGISFWIFAPAIVHFHHFDDSAILMMRALALSVPIYGVRAAPLLILNRKLKFGRIAMVDLTETFACYLVQIAFAMLHMGAWSLVAATLMRSVSGSVALYWIQLKEIHSVVLPKIDPLWIFRKLKVFLKFGIAFQANAIIPALRGMILPLILSPLLSVSEIGVLVWTTGLASIPVMLAVNFNQVVFPSLSRLQDDEIAFRRITVRSTKVALLIFAFLFGLAAAMSSSLINLLFAVKWAEAKPIFPTICLFVSLSTLRYLTGSFLNSSGKAHVRVWLELFALVFEMLLVWYCVARWGRDGYLWSLVVANFVALLLSGYFVKYLFDASVYRRLIVVALFAWLPVVALFRENLQNNFFVALFGFIFIFCGGVFLFDQSVKEDIRYVWNSRT